MRPAGQLVSTHRHTGANVKHEVLTIFHKLKSQKTPMTTLNIIGQRIAQKRKEKGLSQEDLVGLCEIDRSYLSEIENGHKNFSVTVLMKITKALGIRSGDLVD
jgi:ribosome-binding protein aMBF1 (putative translation factor)